VKFRKITAFVPRESLERVELALREMGVPAITVTQAKGYGEYKNFFAHDWKVGTARIEIFTTSDEAEPIASTIMDAAHAEHDGAAGIVAILPVEQLYHIRTRAPASEADIRCGREDSSRPDEVV
jgi:nitrogen regulatory protein PII